MPTSHIRIALFTASLCLALLGLQSDAPRGGHPPSTRAGDVKESFGNVEIADPYRWLEEQNAPETRAWIDEQNKYSEAFLRAFPGRDAIQQRVTELLKIDTIDVPQEHGGRYFFTKRLADQDLPVLYVRKGAGGKDEVLLDPHPLSADHRTSITLLDVTHDGNLIAYGVRQGGEDEVTVKFLDVNTRKGLADLLPRARYSGVALKNDKSGVFFSCQEKEGPRVFFHALGSDLSKDEKLFGDGYGPEKGLGVGLSDDNRYLLMNVWHGSAATKTEVYVRDLVAGGPIVPIVNDLEARFSPDIAGDTLYLETNWQAPKGRVLAVDLKNPARDRWKEVVPAGSASIQGVSTVGGRLFVRYLENVLPRIRIFDTQGKPRGEISFPSVGSASGLRGEWGKNEAFFTFSSFVTPTTIYRYDVSKGTREVWAKESVPVAGDRFEVKQVKYASKDGTQIPMFLVHRKGLKLDGSSPTLLTGYGGFQSLGDAGLLGPRRALGRERRGVRAPQSARRRRVRRGLAQGRDAREKAERLRRLHRRGAVADLERIHVPFQARDLGRLQRRTARGRGLDTTPGPLRRGRLLLSASRHGALSEVPGRGLLGSRIRLGRQPRAVPVPLRLLPLSPREGRHEVPGRALHHGRLGHARRAAPRAQDGRAAPGLDRLGPPDLPPLRHQGGSLRRSHARHQAHRRLV